MDNGTYDELSLTPVSSDATYSRLRTTQTKIKPNDELLRITDIDPPREKVQYPEYL